MYSARNAGASELGLTWGNTAPRINRETTRLPARPHRKSRGPETAARPNLSTRKKTRVVWKLSFQMKVLYVTLWAMVVASSVALASRYAAMAAVGYRMDGIRVQAAALDRENEQLRAQVAGLKSPTRIEEIATRKLGMIRPEKVQLATIDIPNSAPAGKETAPPPVNLAEVRSGAGLADRLGRALLGFWAGGGRAEARGSR